MLPYPRIVVKLGTSTLTDGSQHLSAPRMVDLVRQMALVHDKGCELILVSSGAIAAGRETLGYPDLPRFIPKKQMLAAVGQPCLMAKYADYFGIYQKKVAQVLLTRSDLADRRRYLNARDTFQALIHQGIIPIVNENDTIATEEIRFGDNDNLSAQVASLVEADLLLLLTDQDGVFTDDPRRSTEARLIEQIGADVLSEELVRAGESQNGLGTGGMATKLHAADLARRAGIRVFIARGNAENVILRIANGEHIGTSFEPLSSALESRKRYLLAGEKSSGALVVDAGAARALSRGGSLLPVGVLNVEGDFERGDTVRVTNQSGKVLALGITNYSSRDIQRLCGKRSADIEGILGFSFGDEVIHRNNMVVMRKDDRR
ncbi:glutamate 5-kinase [Anaerolinea thermolimosa]|nr:glutamate 5-kinase [Anaerolinea thermolimosa]GAP06323.1 glutamate 5-kinase [Anaerolinea thermolimosa]